MSKYLELLNNPAKLLIAKNSKEVIFTTISCMCDNEGNLRFSKNNEGEFKMSGLGSAISNWQMKYKQFEIEWKADEGKWEEVAKMINSGTSQIEKVVQR